MSSGAVQSIRAYMLGAAAGPKCVSPSCLQPNTQITPFCLRPKLLTNDWLIVALLLHTAAVEEACLRAIRRMKVEKESDSSCQPM